MENTFKKMRKGFTLIELIIVMAIFSVLMVGVMSLLDPVSNIFKSTSINENAYSASNNILSFLKNELEYADNVWVITGPELDTLHTLDGSEELGNSSGAVDDNDIIAVAEDYRKTYFENTVSYCNDDSVRSAILSNSDLEQLYKSVTAKPLEGTVYVLCLKNNGTDAGHITRRAFNFNSVTEITDIEPEADVLNPAFFEAKDAVYNYCYALGASELVTNSDKTQSVKADKNDTVITMSIEDLAFNMVLNRRKDGFTNESTYRKFNNPAYLECVNIPLMNIIHRNGITTADRNVFTTKPDPEDATKEIAEIKKASTLGLTPASFRVNPGSGNTINGVQANFNNDIYVIYSYADENH